MKTLPASRGLSKLNKQQVPVWSILLISVLACVYSLIGNFDQLTDLAVFACWIFYTLTFAAVFKLRKDRPADPARTYKVPLYPVIPALAILGGLYVIVSQLFLNGASSTWMSLASILVTVIGLPVFFLVRKFGKGKE